MIQILVLEPDDAALKTLERAIRRLGYDFVAANDMNNAIQCVKERMPDLAIVSLDHGSTCASVAEVLSGEFKVPLLVLMENYDAELIDLFQSWPPEGFLVKPLHEPGIELSIKLAIQRIQQGRARDLVTAALADSEAKLRGIFFSAADGVILSDENGIILTTNPRADMLFGYGAGELAGQSVEVLVPEHLRELHHSRRAKFVASPTARPMGQGLNILACRKDGSEFHADVSLSTVDTPSGRVTTSVIQDISAKVVAEQALKRLTRVLRVLSASNETLIRASDEKSLLAGTCRIIAEKGGYPLVWVGYLGDLPGDTLRVAAHVGDNHDFVDCWANGAPGCRASIDAAISGEPVIMRLPNGHAQVAEKPGYAAVIALPVKDGSTTLGVLSIFTHEKDAFNHDEVRLLSELSADLAFGIVSARGEVARRAAEARLKLFARVIESSANGVMISDMSLADNPIIFVNPAFERITGFTAAEAIGRNARFLLEGDVGQLALEDLRSALRNERETQVVLRNYRRDGTLFWNELSLAPVKDEQGTTHFVGIINDITERKRYETQLEHQATHDALTGLANRSLLFDRLAQAMAYAERGNRWTAVMLLDLDRFKYVNDTLGHNAGDQILLTVAGRLQGTVRSGDTVARLGGDEFILVLSDVALEQDIAVLARKIMTCLASPVKIDDGSDLFLNASIGIALFPRDGTSPEGLLKNADVAMYRAKDQGGNKICFYAPEMEARVRHRLTMEHGLRRALESEEFALHYQPQADLTSDRIIGAEALLRWFPPGEASPSPVEFIPVAEQSGLIIPIGRWVITTVAKQIRSWLDAGLDVVPIAVNLSVRQIQDTELVAWLVTELADIPLTHCWLKLEITESAMMENLNEMLAVLSKLRNHGFSIALDDFGTGYSSLSYVKSLPIDIVKIDRSFIKDVTTNPEDAAIVQATISMAHSLGLKVIAEGVETEAQLNYLRHWHCDRIQGYLFSRPVPTDSFAALLREERRLPGGQQEAGQPPTVLLVDDEPHVISALTRALRHEGYRILSASTGLEALHILARESVQVIISDQWVPGMSGTEFLSRVSQIHPAIIRILLSSYTDLDTIMQAVNQGAVFRFLCKPWEDNSLREAVRDAYMLYKARQASQ